MSSFLIAKVNIDMPHEKGRSQIFFYLYNCNTFPEYSKELCTIKRTENRE